MNEKKIILDINNCSICYTSGHEAVSGVSLSVKEGEIISIVGESGSGKTTLIRAILGLLPPGGRIKKGSLIFEGVDLAKASEADLQDIRGRKIAMIFQDVGNSMDPIQKVRTQYTESIRVHEKLAPKEYPVKEKGMLKVMRLNDPDRVLDSYPFELSGGMKQRVGIAMGMTARPSLLLADEPTSALDVTIQAQVVREMKRLRDTYQAAIILVTHNMGVASYISDRIGVMCRGELVEFGPRDEIIYHPQHSYTKKLMEAVPKLHGEVFFSRSSLTSAEEKPLLCVSHVSKSFPVKKNQLRAVQDVSFTLRRGECLGIVGESGCGKSTLAKILTASQPASEGSIQLNGIDYTKLKGREMRLFRRNIQMVFQDPVSSFSPRMKVGTYLMESRRNYDHISRAEAEKEAAVLLERVGLPASFAQRYPHQLSGGQLQRVAIARAIAIHPQLLMCDEATGALDVSIQDQIAHLLAELVKKEQIGCIFIGHDLALVRSICHRIAVMYLGRIVEVLESESLNEKAAHPYTKALLSSIFDVYCDQTEEIALLGGEPPSPLTLREGCAFADRCSKCTEHCRRNIPVLKETEPGHETACWAL